MQFFTRHFTNTTTGLMVPLANHDKPWYLALRPRRKFNSGLTHKGLRTSLWEQNLANRQKKKQKRRKSV